MPPKLAGKTPLKQRGRRKEKKPPPPTPPPAPPPTPWIELPPEITSDILHRLGAVQILKTAQKVCTTWRSVCKDPAMWRVIDMRIDDYLSYITYSSFAKMCRHAVDRSRGQLVEINLEHLATDECLYYIASRSGNLRRLRLFDCCNLYNECVTEAIKSFPKLESLDISDRTFPSESIEMVGRSCPLLSSFAYDKKTYGFYSKTDEEAFAIARSMPELRRGNGLTNKGLEAILDGCPHLESLDLCRCYFLKLEGSALEKRLSSQLKCLKHSEDRMLYSKIFYTH